MENVNKQLLDAANNALDLLDQVTSWRGLSIDGKSALDVVTHARQAIAAAERAQQAESVAPGLYAILYRDNWDGEGDVYHMLAEYKDGEWHADELGKELLQYEGDAILRVWPLTDDKDQPPAVAVPDGYALVPIEPTEEMLDAARQIAIDWPDGFPNHLDGYRAMLAAAPQAAVPAQAAAIPDELTCEDIERLRLALSWEGYSTPESLEACAARWPSLVRDLIAGVLDRKKRTQAAAQKGGA